jgi:Fe-S cluster assembly iron-binding protein IscA
MIDITERASAAVIQMAAAARGFDPTARIRLSGGTSGVAFGLTDVAESGDQELDCGGVVLLIEAGLDGIIDIGEHNAPVLLPPSG